MNNGTKVNYLIDKLLSLKYLLPLLAAVAIFLPNAAFSNSMERIRESTIVYKLKENATPAELKRFNALLNKQTVVYRKEIKGVKINVVKVKNIKGLEKAFSKQLKNTGAVKFALPDASVPHDAVPNDPYYNPEQWHHPKINTPTAWDNITGPSNFDAVKVCVLDTGVQTAHPDLAANLLLPGYNSYLNTEGNVEGVLDHGTKTAGVIGAIGNNDLGVTGMAWDINIIPVKINYDDVGTRAYYSDMADGITWCANQGGVKVANLSYGGAHRPEIAEAAQYLRDRGGLLFMPAGNDGTYNSATEYPDYSAFIVVGATDEADVKTSFSEYGPFVDIAAPGSYIYTTTIGGYSYGSGTSYSSPIVAGVAALIYAINPDFTPLQVENYIFNTAVDLGDSGEDELYGNGRVDAGAAVVAAMGYSQPNTPPVVVATADPTSGTAPLTVAFGGSGSTDDGAIVSYIWNYGDGNSGSGVESSHTYTDTGTYTATLTVTDNLSAQTVSDPMTITITVAQNADFIVAPSGLTSSVDGSTVALSWSDNSTNEEVFEVHRAQKIRGKYNYAMIGTTMTPSYEDAGVVIGNYKYKVRAAGFYGEVISDFSNEVAVKVETSSPATPGALPAPVLSASIAGTAVNLSWTHDCPADFACTYQVQRGDTKVRGRITFEDYDPIVDSLAITITEAPGTYYYRVKASEDNDDVSDFSNVVTARIK